MSDTVAIKVRRRRSNDTRDAYCIMNPTNPLKMLFLPRSEVVSMRDDEHGCWMSLPTWLAREKGLE